MFLTVRVIRNRQTALVIPEQCIVPEQDRKYVFVIENDTAEKRQVTTPIDLIDYLADEILNSPDTEVEFDGTSHSWSGSRDSSQERKP